MTLPTYDKSKRRKAFQQLPKGAYVIKIKDAKEDKWPSGDTYVRIAFDIAEGEYANFYQKQFENNSNEDKKWPMDAVFNLACAGKSSEACSTTDSPNTTETCTTTLSCGSHDRQRMSGWADARSFRMISSSARRASRIRRRHHPAQTTS